MPQRRRGERHTDVFLGAGGRLVQPDSEGEVLTGVIQQLHRINRGMFAFEGAEWVERDLSRQIARLEKLRDQVSQGYHRNGMLAIYGNPPRRGRGVAALDGGVLAVAGEISREAHAILYRHAEDGECYRHDFETPVGLVAVEVGGQRTVIFVPGPDVPLWADF